MREPPLITFQNVAYKCNRIKMRIGEFMNVPMQKKNRQIHESDINLQGYKLIYVDTGSIEI